MTAESVETRLDGRTLVVRIPMHFQRRGGNSATTWDGEPTNTTGHRSTAPLS